MHNTHNDMEWVPYVCAVHFVAVCSHDGLKHHVCKLQEQIGGGDGAMGEA